MLGEQVVGSDRVFDLHLPGPRPEDGIVVATVRIDVSVTVAEGQFRPEALDRALLLLRARDDVVG
jgi:hypothetical protein